jgi:hypothetical protein
MKEYCPTVAEIFLSGQEVDEPRIVPVMGFKA